MITNTALNWQIDTVATPIDIVTQLDAVALLGSISVTGTGTKVVSGFTATVPIEINNGAFSATATTTQALKTIITTGSITVTGASYFDNSILLKAGGVITQGASQLWWAARSPARP